MPNLELRLDNGETIDLAVADENVDKSVKKLLDAISKNRGAIAGKHPDHDYPIVVPVDHIVWARVREA